ncbi:MAG: hypothetical protein RL657_2845, partial [Pseudomonadota bacterium]
MWVAGEPEMGRKIAVLEVQTQMAIFRRPDYQSDTTQFLSELRQQSPELEARQRQGRALLWDKHIDRDVWSEYRAARVAQKPYVYQTQ